MKRKRIRIRKITDVPKKYVQFLHPSLRSIVESRNRRWKVRRAEWLKVRNRLLYYRPQARVFPWYCEVCTLSSRFLSVIQEHSCSNKNLSRHVQDFTNEQRIALLGFRSKAKDALAVMERVVNPQAIDLGKVSFPSEGHSSLATTLNRVPRLSEICLAVLSPGKKRNGQLSRGYPFQIKNGSYRYRHPRRTGQLCNVCRKLFPIFTDYEAHLVDGNCSNEMPPDPVPIHMSDSGNVPSNYDLSPITECAKATAKPRVMICSLCHDDRFSSVTMFHEHIIECARKLAFCGGFSS
uniref:Tick transposon n=1 Tax=Haemonchus contortus TaxID=6289 RepID=A0A7I4Y9I8_HAECO